MAAHSCNASAVHRTRWWIILTTAHAPRFPRKVSNSEPESSRTSPSGSHPDLKQWATIAVGNRGTWQFRVSECYHDSDSDSQPCILYHCDEPERLQLRLPFTSPGVVGGVATIPDDSDSDSEPLLDFDSNKESRLLLWPRLRVHCPMSIRMRIRWTRSWFVFKTPDQTWGLLPGSRSEIWSQGQYLTSPIISQWGKYVFVNNLEWEMLQKYK